jgi:hypothetical protein
MLMRLDRTDILAHALEIRGMAKRPIGKLRCAADCAICSQPMRVGEAARLLPKKVVSHPKCVEQLVMRLDEAIPKREPVPAGELPFEGEPFVVE